MLRFYYFSTANIPFIKIFFWLIFFLYSIASPMTSTLLEKSKENLRAAQMLKGSCYSATVNRAYYSCVQFILDVLYTRLNITPTQFYAQRIQNREGTHSWASKLIEIELAKMDKEDFKWFQKKFPEFQELREKADYTNDLISQPMAEIALRTNESLTNIVNKIKKRT